MPQPPLLTQCGQSVPAGFASSATSRTQQHIVHVLQPRPGRAGELSIQRFWPIGQHAASQPTLGRNLIQVSSL